ncbi:MAG TPA: [protein-PII] uridylyltransferase [Lacipirellulaceae bacterium]|nr:[protein-PII] uridylyltransferase [Lacipirellulaceae bacterium]
MAAGDRLRSIVREVRQTLVEGRQELRAQHDRGLEGARVCARYTSLVDTAISRIYDAYLSELPPSDAAQLRERVSLVAHGGYGRRQQAPFSDVDLMILYSGKRDALISQLASRLLQDICDVYQHLGHSVRTATDTVRLARTDAQIGTSLIESRLLLGSSDVYNGYSEMMRALIQKRGPVLARDFILERRKERLEYGETVYLLEPNVKRSRGGLRDIHLLRWLWYLKAGVADPDRLHDMGVVSKFDHRRLISAQNFLLRVRNEMHFHANETCDALSRAEQLRLAEYFKYAGRDGMLPVEQFMRDYFHHTSHVWRMAHRLSELMQPTSKVSRMLQPMLGRKTEDDYQISRHEVSATPRATARLAQHPEEVLKLVDLARCEGKRISQDTWHYVYRTAPQYSNEPKAAVVELFLKILANPVRLGELLRRLHDMGVLEKIIPEFHHARSLLQFNQYHKYTVDEHCIRTVEEASKFGERQDILGEVYRNFTDKTTLHLALLLHDLGKGFEEDHSEVGRRIAQSTAQRLGLPNEQAATLEFLVHNHLRMSHVALRFDTTQPQLVERFAEEVGTKSRLEMLFLVTCADLAGVGPDVLSSWKVEVLTDLYLGALQKFESADAAVPLTRDTQRTAVWQLLSTAERSDAWFERQLAALPESFFAKRSPEAVVESLRRLRHLAPRAGLAWANYLKDTETVEFIAGIDEGSGRAIFSSMAGALTSKNMQILAAETNVLANDLLLMRYVASEPESPGEPSSERLAAICDAMVKSIDSDEIPRFPKILGREQQAAGAVLTNLPNEVRINNEISGDCAVVEVFTVDHRGLLYRLARALHDAGLVIRFAKIGTYLDQVVDVFYVAERDGQKPRGDERLAQIRGSLMAVIAPAKGSLAPALSQRES